MTYTKRKKEEAETGDGRFCAITPFRNYFKDWLGGGWKRACMTYSFLNLEKPSGAMVYPWCKTPWLLNRVWEGAC